MFFDLVGYFPETSLAVLQNNLSILFALPLMVFVLGFSICWMVYQNVLLFFKFKIFL